MKREELTPKAKADELFLEALFEQSREAAASQEARIAQALAAIDELERPRVDGPSRRLHKLIRYIPYAAAVILVVFFSRDRIDGILGTDLSQKSASEVLEACIAAAREPKDRAYSIDLEPPLPFLPPVKGKLLVRGEEQLVLEVDFTLGKQAMGYQGDEAWTSRGDSDKSFFGLFKLPRLIATDFDTGVVPTPSLHELLKLLRTDYDIAVVDEPDGEHVRIDAEYTGEASSKHPVTVSVVLHRKTGVVQTCDILSPGPLAKPLRGTYSLTSEEPMPEAIYDPALYLKPQTLPVPDEDESARLPGLP